MVLSSAIKVEVQFIIINMTWYYSPFVLFLILLVCFCAAVGVMVLQTNNDYNHETYQDWILVGGVNSTSADFRIRSSNVLFVVSKQESLEVRLVEERVGQEQVNQVYAANVLEPQTTYYYATLRNDAVVQRGQFSTPATEGERFDFTFGVAGCAWTGSKADIFRQIADRNPLFLLHMGDFHYKDVYQNDMNKRLNAVDLVMGSDSQREMFSKLPLAYIWDDHDWLGNDSGAEEKEKGARETALRSYQLAFPHHRLALEGVAVPPYHAFTVGTVRFIITDLRSEATNSSIYSDEQQTWLFSELSQADQYDFVIWASSKPWIGDADGDFSDSTWFTQTGNRQELSAFISETLAQKQNLLVVASDAHMLGFDDGSNTYYGGAGNGTLSFPILQSGPFDRLGSVKGGPLSDGCHSVKYERNHQYSTVSFSGNGTEPCLEINAYDGQELVMNRKLCGQIFKASAPGTGECAIPVFTDTSIILLSATGVVCFLILVLSCISMGLKQGACISFTVIGVCAATLATIGIPYARGISQWSPLSVFIIALVQVVLALFYCFLWFRSVRKSRNQEKRDVTEEDDKLEHPEEGDDKLKHPENVAHDEIEDGDIEKTDP